MNGKNPQEQINEISEQLTPLKELLCVGTVSTIYASEHMARVKWSAPAAVSEKLNVVQRGDGWMPSVGQSVLCVKRKDGGGFVLGGL
ncbi:MAG: hypothetical protein LUE89_11415 [Clostridiales bacterium]|nr:hypothetical protein [Clostridiales bacterium]